MWRAVAITVGILIARRWTTPTVITVELGQTTKTEAETAELTATRRRSATGPIVLILNTYSTSSALSECDSRV
eukprot:g61401.t1